MSHQIFLPSSFFGLDTPYEESRIVLLGCPLDDTSSFRPGTRFGPNYIRNNSLSLEDYSPNLNKGLAEIPFKDMGDISLPTGSKERALDMISHVAEEIFKARKLLISIGGEHLISLPLIREAKRAYPETKVIHLDAHADLRDQYQGDALSHATVMRRVIETTGKHTLHQIGIRSGTKEEFGIIRESKTLYGTDSSELLRLKSAIGDAPCYISLDIDILDPGLFPAVGTPEPGGIDFNTLLNILYSLKGLNIIAMDLVEYNPLMDTQGNCSIAAGKIIREMLLML